MSQHKSVYVILSCAMSLDGYIDDNTREPLLLSSQKDLDEVDALRSSCDAILVGAGTLRADDPRLVVKSEARRAARMDAGKPRDITKVTVTRSGDIPSDRRFFTTGDGPKIVYCTPTSHQRLSALLAGIATVVALGAEEVDPAAVLQDLADRGVSRLLIEGGSAMHTMFLEADLVDEARVAIAPFFVGEETAPRFVNPARFPFNSRQRARLINCRSVEDMAVLTYRFEPRRVEEGTASQAFVEADSRWLMQTIELSRRCVFSPNAFCVGAIIIGPDGAVISTGYSRETGPKAHAEEVAIARAQELGASLSDATLFTSLEPCSIRLSGRTPCTQLILNSGLRRVVYALAEPPTFVNCTGARDLASQGVEVIHLSELGWLVEDIIAHGKPE